MQKAVYASLSGNALRHQHTDSSETTEGTEAPASATVLDQQNGSQVTVTGSKTGATTICCD
ncbi:MAG: hypothetical protein ACLSA6_05695 [Holdemania massiliensis]